ncbi:MAG: beta-lactamase family protein [Saprospiraceae bacterium]|nr:beta-lactamase family protein [Saprospiraceae bacterium]
MRHVTLAILVLSFIVSCTSKNSTVESSTAVKKSSKNWPTPSWEYDTIDDASLFKPVVDSFPGKYSLLIVNNGKIAFEHYQEPYSKDSVIHINSCTKTVISMLFGAVFKEQFAGNENRAAIDYFPEYTVDDSLIQKIKVKHFLSMSSGLDWKGGIDASDVIQMSNTNDWAKYVFQRKVTGPPGENFHYNSGGSQVVSTILHKQTEEGLMAFARENLFKPLGISELKWDSTINGVPKAGWGLHLKMHDMAKLGYLLLNKGKWKDLQIVPEEWVSNMSSKHVVANDKYDYGYQVWIPKNIGTECFLFRGSYPPSTKIVAVLPELNSVVVYVGENYNTNTLLQDFIVPKLKKKAGNK